ncbi:dicarboxylate/amino acid:cation symporter [Dyella sp. GSA-30]|uniref:dicarboxylate/amino acid:cation symporter n=1 Tax=Dyella sp. GSA-30 TaxID=2994496 RepID=UPI002493B36B|nr:dicarboxylate/amino acid:cation symporter [Dyella sp. GSA-30]BDU20020.1 C4-dicarboxylate ABC transporter [Dyella sp. GSA-30]
MPAKQRWFTALLIAATVLGIALGWLCNHALTPQQNIDVAADLSIVTDAFLRLIKMIIAPLVFASLVPAIARMGGVGEIGRIGIKALAWFLGASCLSLTIGLLMGHWLQPGASLHLPLASPGSLADQAGFTFADFMTHLIPRSIVEAMAGNEILQIVVFSIFVGSAAAALKDKVLPFVEAVEQLAAIMFKVTDYVMKAAPLAIFAALAAAVCVHGIGMVGTYARFVGGFYVSLAILWALLIAALVLIVGPRSLRLLGSVRQPVLLAFATSSSEAAYPRLLEKLVAFGIPQRIASFVLPLGYSFNLDGAMMYCSFAILFIAQAYGIDLSLGQQLTLFGLLIVTTKGVAGVPRAAIAVIAITLHYFKLPDSGVALVLAVDHVLDMGRSATNILGNAVTAAVVARWEKQIQALPDIDIAS